ncbi:BPSS1780 family membrane protein [Amphritea balenae]|uniref:BPSS1780 family membrane protein n=1 Tax=Amphritea balenae TaxID=452629 RepID=UPI0019B90A4E|nr:BPSS1780 family membrane protein [Amphritea balenae]GGK69881.1 hypothetical protein GCM10007941_20150 [Amphritea balenae]
MSELYKVVYTGKLDDNRDPEQVINLFSERFKCSLDKARKLVLSQKDVVIKSGLDETKAKKYQAVLNSMGMQVSLVSLTPAPKAFAFEMEDDDSSTESGDSDSAGDHKADGNNDVKSCPKCGSKRLKDDNCLGCGIIISKYLALQETDQHTISYEATPQPVTETVSSNDNPYQAPEADLAQEYEEGEISGPVSVPVSHSWRWLTQGFGHFKQNPVAWILTMVIWIVISVVISLIPGIGSLAITLLSPVIAAGYMLGCREQEEGGDFRIGHLFSGFSNNVGQLILVGVLYLVGSIVIVVAIGMFAGGTMFMLGGGDPSAMGPEMMSALMIPILIAMLFFIPLLMAYWFAPVLVALNDMSAIAAMKMSFSACLKNMLPFLVYGLLGAILMMIGMIPIGLGLLIVMPMFVASMYVSYRDIFYS